MAEEMNQKDNAESLNKDMSGKGGAEKMPSPSGKPMDATVPEVKKKDGAQYKDIGDEG